MAARPFIYPLILTPDDGTVMVEFPDIPGALTQGADEAEALANAPDCLVAALGGYIELRHVIPRPSPARGRPVVALPPLVATKVALYLLSRILFTIFNAYFAFGIIPLGDILMVLALAAMFVASTVAIFQDNIKRMLAYSSIAQIGYMILGISFYTATGLTAGILHLFNHALMKGGLFLALGCVFYRIGSVRIDDMAGIGREMPWTMAAFVVGGLGLIGVPLTVGFISKWYLIQAALELGWWPIAVLVLAASLLAVIYVWRVVEAAYFKPAPAGREAVTEAPLSMVIPTWTLIGASIYFGIHTELTVGVAGRAALSLLSIK